MSGAAAAPTREDSFAATVSRRIGGPIGRHAQSGQSWFTPTRVAILTATLVWILGAIQKLPCRVTVAGQYPDTYKRLCYSDIPLLYTARGLADGHIPYLDHGKYQTLEYPVLTGWLLEFERRITVWLGAPVGPGLSAQQSVDAARLFSDVNLVVLGVFFIVAVWAQARTYPASSSSHRTPAAAGRTDSRRAWDAMLLAASPCVLLAGFINWDLLPVALTALGFTAWSRRRPALAGVMFGLGTAAKLYPLLLLGPLLLLCLRSGRMRDFGRMLVGFVIAWLVPNLPVIILAPGQWLTFWTFNADRSGDLGSIWYVLSLAGHPVAHLNVVAPVILVLLCAGIGWLIVTARRRPRFGQVAYLVIAAFLITNKVYSPQYVLWLLPLLVLARPRWREWWIFTIGEIAYFLAIWGHLDQTLGPGNGGPDRIYWLAVIVRIGCEVWVGLVIVRDILDPDRHDPLRALAPAPDADPAPRPEPAARPEPREECLTPPQAETQFDDFGAPTPPDTTRRGVIHGLLPDDPAGGVLTGAPDAGWVTRLRAALAARPAREP